MSPATPPMIRLVQIKGRVAHRVWAHNPPDSTLAASANRAVDPAAPACKVFACRRGGCPVPVRKAGGIAALLEAAPSERYARLVVCGLEDLLSPNVRLAPKFLRDTAQCRGAACASQ
eukprot:6254172-Amphidinium_carterae.3